MNKVGVDDYIAARGARAEDLDALPRIETWPSLAPEALHGLAGRIVMAIDPYTEADPIATLAHVLISVGNLVGPGPHVRVQHDYHPPRLNACLVGRTAKARKGLAWSTPRHMLRQVDDGWARTRIRTGLSSGEGLIYHVRDSRKEAQPVKEKGCVVRYEQVLVDEGESDKRLLVLEPELAVVLKRMGGEGNSLSGVLREAWDSGNLSTLTKNSPIRATGAHVSVIAHTTQEELLRYLTETERANGFANRFLWFLVRRSKALPEGEAIPDGLIAPLVEELRAVVTFARTIGEVRRDEAASAIWAEVYGKLSEGEPGMVGAIISRAEAQVVRLSVLYAMLDRSLVVTAEHLKAGLAVWDAAETSARFVFGGSLGYPVADRILGALRARGALSETDIRDLFGRHQAAQDLDAALAFLAEKGKITKQSISTGGRPRTVWVATKAT